MTPALRLEVIALLRLHQNACAVHRLLGGRDASPVGHATILALAAEAGVALRPGRPRGPGKKYSAHRAEVQRLLGEGKTAKEVAAALGITHQAVYQLRKAVVGARSTESGDLAEELRRAYDEEVVRLMKDSKI